MFRYYNNSYCKLWLVSNYNIYFWIANKKLFQSTSTMLYHFYFILTSTFHYILVYAPNFWTDTAKDIHWGTSRYLTLNGFNREISQCSSPKLSLYLFQHWNWYGYTYTSYLPNLSSLESRINNTTNCNRVVLEPTEYSALFN